MASFLFRQPARERRAAPRTTCVPATFTDALAAAAAAASAAHGGGIAQ